MAKKKRAKKRILIIIPCVVAVLLTGVILAFVLFPFPAAMLMRSMFEKPNLAAPDGYAQMKENVITEKNLAYTSAYKDNSLDLYLPKAETGTKLPLIIWIHGGAYVGGDKSDIEIYATALASEGYAVASVNYRRAPEANYPVPVIQLGEATEWLNAQADTYRLDMTHLLYAGDSAGAHTVSAFALVQTNPAYAALTGISATNAAPPEAIKGVLLYCGPFDVQMTHDIGGLFGFMLKRAGWAYFGTAKWADKFGEEASIKAHVTADYPPAFITDGNTASFPQQGKALADALQAKSVPVTSYFPEITFEKTAHEYQFLMNTPAGKECFDLTKKFITGRVAPAA